MRFCFVEYTGLLPTAASCTTVRTSDNLIVWLVF